MILDITVEMLLINQYFCISLTESLFEIIKRNNVPELYIIEARTIQKFGDA